MEHEVAAIDKLHDEEEALLERKDRNVTNGRLAACVRWPARTELRESLLPVLYQRPKKSPTEPRANTGSSTARFVRPQIPDWEATFTHQYHYQ